MPISMLAIVTHPDHGWAYFFGILYSHQQTRKYGRVLSMIGVGH
jgi:hypothetical protein